MENEIIEQWNLPYGAKVKLDNDTIAIFKHMDGMYAKWDIDGELGTGNFKGFKKVDDYYIPVN